MSHSSDISIPLICIICPSRPNFSDLSHLLTHVSSKAHLSHKFKTQVRAATDPDAQRTLDSYEEWYGNNGLEGLLSDRLATKEAKKGKADRRFTRPKQPLFKRPTRRRYSLEEMEHRVLLDRQISRAVKQEHKNPTATPYGSLETRNDVQLHGPRMHLWRNASRKSQVLDPNSQSPSISTEFDSNSRFNTPSPDSRVDPFLDYSSNHLTRSPSIGLKPILESTPATSHDSDDTTIQKVNGCLQLKGHFWPGMDIFDSATPEMKRLRNQKKDGSILERMKISSAKVEPVELVFLDGQLKRERRISGLDEDSPRSPTPKKRTARFKKDVLKDIDCNLSITLRNAANSAQASVIDEDKAKKRINSSRTATSPGFRYGWRDGAYDFEPTVDEYRSYGTSDGLQAPVAKRNLEVFRDHPGANQGYEYSNLPEDLEEGHMHVKSDRRQYGWSNLLDSSMLNSQLADTMPLDAPDLDYLLPLQKSIDTFVRPFHRTSGKENVEPILNRYGRIDVDASRGLRAERTAEQIAGVSHLPQIFNGYPQNDSKRFQDTYQAIGPNPLASAYQHSQLLSNPFFQMAQTLPQKTHGQIAQNGTNSYESFGTFGTFPGSMRDSDMFLTDGMGSEPGNA